MDRQWIALFSQTGKELKELCSLLGRVPDITLCTNELVHHCTIPGRNVFVTSKEGCEAALRRLTNKGDLVTLHGYLYILPKDIIMQDVLILNGHPGLINVYPDLKGRDPQRKVIINPSRYPTIGSVVHVVTEDVDGGEIVAHESATRPNESGERILEILRELSLKAWMEVLPYEFR